MRRAQLAAGVTVGSLVMFFVDPQQGRRRRAVAADKMRSRKRRLQRTIERRRRDRRQREMGEQLEREGLGSFHPVDDIAIASHLHQVLSELDFSTSDVTVEVVDGLARVRGQLSTPRDIDTALQVICLQPGVELVESYLHLPHEPAPNKAAALAASHSGRH